MPGFGATTTKRLSFGLMPLALSESNLMQQIKKDSKLLLNLIIFIKGSLGKKNLFQPRTKDLQRSGPGKKKKNQQQ